MGEISLPGNGPVIRSGRIDESFRMVAIATRAFFWNSVPDSFLFCGLMSDDDWGSTLPLKMK